MTLVIATGCVIILFSVTIAFGRLASATCPRRIT